METPERYEAAGLPLIPVYVRYLYDSVSGSVATEAAQRESHLARAEARYREEQRVPYGAYFGGRDLSPYLRGKDVLDFGSFAGGMARMIVEKYQPARITGVDVESEDVIAARVFFEEHHLNGRFTVYPGDILPFGNAEFDTIYTFDVFQHVADLATSVRECFRVLRPGGQLLVVFPSFYHPTSHYLHMVSGTPCVHYFFSRDTLGEAYEQLLDERGERAKHYRRATRGFEPWERTFMNNGMSKRRFRSLVREAGFKIELDYPLALGRTGHLRRRVPLLRALVPIFALPARLPFLEEVFCHRIVMILRKPA
jgi:SAM-dependent methyltransferase